MNEILAKNLSCLKRYNVSLANQIEEQNSLTAVYELSKTQNDEYNLVINGVSVHSPVNAQNEAKCIYNSLPHNDNVSIHVTFGLGLGYLFKELVENARGTIILFENNIETLRAVFEIVDFSDCLAKDNVFVVSNIEDLKTFYLKAFSGTSKITMTFLDYYKATCKFHINEVIKALEKVQGIAKVSYKFKKENSARFSYLVSQKIEQKIQMPCVSLLKDKFKDLPAIIVSAGASLYDNLDLIKKYQNKAVIFCVGTAYKALRSFGIKPDFLCIVESYNVSNQVDGVVTEDVNYITEPTSHDALYDYTYKNIFMYPSRENNINWWYADLVGEKFTQYETKGTVSYNALFSAYITGCNPIILIGQDLGYVNNCCYSKGSPYHSLKCRMNENNKWEIYSDNFEELVNIKMMNTGCEREHIEEKTNELIKNMNQRLAIAKNQEGKDFLTDVSYVLFAQYFSDFAKRFAGERILINSSKGGMNIEGFINTDFQVALEKYAANDIKKDEIVNQAVKNYQVNFEEITAKLNKEIKKLENISVEINSIDNALAELKTNISAGRTTTQRFNQALKVCVNMYLKLARENRDNLSLYRNFTFAEDENLVVFLKDNSQNFSQDSILELHKLLNEYFTNAQNCVNYYIKVLKNTKEKIYESINTTRETSLSYN